MSNNTESHFHDRAEILGTVQFLLCEGATSRAEADKKGYLDLGNFTGVEFKAEAAKVEVYKCDRGVTRVGGNLPGILKHGYDLTTSEIADPRKLKHVFLGIQNGDFSQAALANIAVDKLAFAAAAKAIKNIWYPITKDGALIREISAITIPTLTEGKDFIIDKKLGLVRFIDDAKLPAADITPTVSAEAINSTHPLGLKKIDPLKKGFVKGYGRLLIWDQDDQQVLVMDHKDFSCEVSLSSPPSFTKDAIGEMKLLVTITNDRGEVFHRD